MKKKFPNNQQLVNSNACGPMCLISIYEYFGLTSVANSLRRSLNFANNNFSYVPQMALHLKKSGLKVLLLTSNSQIVEKDWVRKSNNIIIKLIGERINVGIQNWIPTANALMEYLKNHGKMIISNLSVKLLDKYIDEGYVLLVCVDESWLWGKRKVEKTTTFDPVKGKTNGHFVVVYGKAQNKYCISDPYPTNLPNRIGYYKVEKELLLISSLIWDPEIVAVKKKK